MRDKQNWFEDLVNEIPAETADRDYLIDALKHEVSLRTIKALIDAIRLARVEGQ